MPKEHIVGTGQTSDEAEVNATVKWGRQGFVQMTVGSDEFESQWVDLDRSGINRLIRTLRKARDQAYGADA